MEVKEILQLTQFDSIFVDSNILIYHLTGDPLYGEKCRDFIGRVETGDLDGYISSIVISDTLFIYIKAWLLKEKHINPKEILSYLKKNPEVIRNIDLSKPLELFDLFYTLPITSKVIRNSFRYLTSYSLLPDDALNLATMLSFGLRNLATRDTDFDRVDRIQVWRP